MTPNMTRHELKDKVGAYEFLAEPFHCDFSGRLFMGHLGNHMLNAADFHSNDRGYGMNVLGPMHRTWVLSRLVIEMDVMPKAYDKFTVETWVESAMKYFTGRNFAITSADGRVCGYGKSIWAMIDTVTRQPVDILSINDGLVLEYVEKDKPCPIDKPGRARVGEGAKLVRTVDTYYNDVDINGHINSIKYIEHALDLFDVEWFKAHRLKRMEVAYIAETYQGDKLSFFVEETEALHYGIKLVKTDKNTHDTIEVCRMSLFFVKD